MATLSHLKSQFNKIVSHIERDGVLELVNWLENETDFFTAPASTNFHGNYEGGLLEHSIHVVEFALTNFNYMLKYKPEYEYLKESLIISALFHDICKVNQYHKEEKFTKVNGKWATYMGYQFKDDFALGHGEKSVYYISKFVDLKPEEAMAIRWHMGSSEVGTQIPGLTQYSYQEAFKHPLVKLIHSSDVAACSIGDIIDYKSNAVPK